MTSFRASGILQLNSRQVLKHFDGKTRDPEGEEAPQILSKGSLDLLRNHCRIGASKGKVV